MAENKEFSFAAYADEFDGHISSSIRGYLDLREDCVALSRYFIQKDSNVLDIGCSTGSFLRTIRDYNQKKYPSVKYTGIDIEPNFKSQWESAKARNVKFLKTDVRTYPKFENLSVVYSLFTLQFLPEQDRLELVKKIFDGLNEGGAFIFSEKVNAKSGKIHDILRSIYYDFKRKAFSEKDILDKEQAIRDQMHLWSEYKISEMLRSCGFASPEIQIFWRNHLFIGFMAIKPAKYRK